MPWPRPACASSRSSAICRPNGTAVARCGTMRKACAGPSGTAWGRAIREGILFIKRGDESMDWRSSAPHVEELRRLVSPRFIRDFFAPLEESFWMVPVQSRGAGDHRRRRSRDPMRDEERWCVAELVTHQGELLRRRLDQMPSLQPKINSGGHRWAGGRVLVPGSCVQLQ